MNTPRFSGTMLGTGSLMYVSLGFRPDWVKVTNLTSASAERIHWHWRMAAAGTGMPEGEKFTYGASSIAWSKLGYGLGIKPWNGTNLATASAAYVAPKRFNSAYAGNVQGNAKNWTLGSAANRTGNFDAAIDTALVKAGSVIEIRPSSGFVNPIRATILSISNSGSAANEVTLNLPLASGEIANIRYPYDILQAPAGQLGPGFELAADADVNVASEMVLVEAGIDDLQDS